jgi:excisionase family DNA binding protein
VIVTLDIPDAAADAIADAVIARMSTTVATTTTADTSPWLNVQQAAAYIGDAPTSRIYDLVQQHKLTPHRDGRRLLLHRDELDGYLRGAS